MTPPSPGLDALLQSLRACTLCKDLPLGPNPIFQIDPRAKILITGQAPGRITHEKDIAFQDPSGVRLRRWMGISESEFYDTGRIAVLPMGMCFPGTGAGGDLPPRPQCAPTWHGRLLAHMPGIALTLVIGKHAMDSRFAGTPKMTLTERVQTRAGCGENLFPMPHPSPRNNRWLKANPWFEAKAVPDLQARIKEILQISA